MNATCNLRPGQPVAQLRFEDSNSSASAVAMAACRAAQRSWARTTLKERLRIVRKLRRLIAENAPDLADASASARGRPPAESMVAEVLPLAEACRFLERQARRILAPCRLGPLGRPAWLSGVQAEIHREPYGVVLVIGPGNYPLYLPGVQVVQALVAGNAVLLKPGLGGTSAARALCTLLVRVGLPSGLVIVLSEATEGARQAIAAGPDKLLFTGSASIGERILAQAAPRLIPCTMELSGCDAVIVRADADLELAAKALAFGLRFNDGATCLAPKRVFLIDAVATELERRVSEALRSSETDGYRVVSRSLPPTVADRVRPLLDEALARGAHLVTGGPRADGSIPSPLVVASVPAEARLLREDIFGPVVAFVRVADDGEALHQANNCPFALGASVFTRDEKVGRAMAAQIRSGVVTVNDLVLPTADPRLPFGGRKRSGFGVTRGAEGLLGLTVPKVLTVSRSRYRPGFQPTRPEDGVLFAAYLRWAHGRGVRLRLGAFGEMIRAAMARWRTNPR